MRRKIHFMFQFGLIYDILTSVGYLMRDHVARIDLQGELWLEVEFVRTLLFKCVVTCQLSSAVVNHRCQLPKSVAGKSYQEQSTKEVVKRQILNCARHQH